MTARRAAWAGVVAALLCATLLRTAGAASACEARARPIALSYHPSTSESRLRFEGYEETAARAAPSYVRVVVCQAEGGTPRLDEAERKDGIINGASGVIVDASGLIVTAAHIALDPRHDAVVVTLDGQARKARILRVDRNRELALVKIAPFAGMAVAELADSDALQSADAVLAIGTPDNKGGVVSLGRVLVPKLEGRLEYNGFGFADAVKLRIDVEPGNSGGPVFDARGRLIGIVGAFGLPEPGETVSRLGFAVPSNAIRAYLGAR